MLKYETYDQFSAFLEKMRDTPFLAMKLRELAELMQDVDADKMLLLNESATNLDESFAALSQVTAMLWGKENPPWQAGEQ